MLLNQLAYARAEFLIIYAGIIRMVGNTKAAAEVDKLQGGKIVQRSNF